MKTLRILTGVLLIAGAAAASSHREAPAIAYDPAADNTDVYAFLSNADGTSGNAKLNIVANWIPFEEPSSGPNFFKWSDDVQYQIHIARGGTSLADVVTYTFRFKTQPIPRTNATDNCSAPGTAACVGGGKEFFSQITGDAKTTGGYIVQSYTITKSVAGQPDAVISTAKNVAAPWRIGPKTQKTLNALAPALINSATYDDTWVEANFLATNSDGSRTFAGPRDDGFYVDLGGIFDLANIRAKGVAQDGLAGYNVHSIALEIPVAQLTGNGGAPVAGTPDVNNTLGIWASSSRKKVNILRASGGSSGYGPWVQVSRLGLPLINEAVIGLQDKDKYNRTQPKDDVANFAGYFTQPVIVRDAEAVGLYATGGPLNGIDPVPLRGPRTDIIDVISLHTNGGGCTTYPATNCHAITAVGDVLRIDLNLPSGFPNGRSIIPGTKKEGADVTDVELTLLLTGTYGLDKNGGNGGPPLVQDGVDYNDKTFRPAFPWLALPWDGYAEGHGKTTP